MKKRVVAILMTTVVAVGLLAGCGSKGENGGEASTEEGKVIDLPKRFHCTFGAGDKWEELVL